MDPDRDTVLQNRVDAVFAEVTCFDKSSDRSVERFKRFTFLLVPFIENKTFVYFINFADSKSVELDNNFVDSYPSTT